MNANYPYNQGQFALHGKVLPKQKQRKPQPSRPYKNFPSKNFSPSTMLPIPNNLRLCPPQEPMYYFSGPNQSLY